MNFTRFLRADLTFLAKCLLPELYNLLELGQCWFGCSSMAEKPGTESLILASLADHKRSQNHVVLCKQGMYIVCTIVRPEMPGKCTTRTCTMYTMECQIDGTESQDFPKLPQLRSFDVANVRNR